MQSVKYFIGVMQALRFDFVKFRTRAILSFHQCVSSIDPDQTPHYSVSDLGLHCSPMLHKKDTWLIWLSIGLYYFHTFGGSLTWNFSCLFEF